MTSAPLAVVTGASRGIGRSIALAYAKAGYHVFALARSTEALQGLTREVEASGKGALVPLSVDVTDRDALARTAQTVLGVGTPAVLVNNAGIALAAPLRKTALTDFDRVMAVNVTAAYQLCQIFMPEMAAQGGGRVINIASTAALKGFKYTSAYCASKHALLGLTRALAVEFAQKRVTVNAICPGWTATDMLEASASNIAEATGRSVDEAKQTLAQMNPMGRLIRPEEVAELCLFLSSTAAAGVTGSAYSMDGGEAA